MQQLKVVLSSLLGPHMLVCMFLATPIQSLLITCPSQQTETDVVGHWTQSHVHHERAGASVWFIGEVVELCNSMTGENKLIKY